jgi:hypothetical protein
MDSAADHWPAAARIAAGNSAADASHTPVSMTWSMRWALPAATRRPTIISTAMGPIDDRPR